MSFFDVVLFANEARDIIPSLYNGLCGADPCSRANPPKLDNLNVIGVILANVIQIIITLSGVLAVIIITWSGIQYIISQGDPAKVKDAKNSIVYAVVGLVLASTAFLIIEYLVRQFNTATPG